MNCQYLIGICSKTRLPCPHCKVDGKCDEAECTNAVIPTWNELLDIYETAVKPKHSRLRNLRSSLNTLTRALGLAMDDKVAVTDEQMDAAYAKLAADHEPETIETIFGALKATTSSRREIKMEYRRRTKQIPDIDTPAVEKKAKPVVQLTDAQRLAVREMIAKLRQEALAGSATSRSRFLWLFFAWYFGVRPKDIGRLKWANIATRSNGSTWLDYVPTKTDGKRAGGRMTEEQIEMLRPFVGKPEDDIIPLHANRMPKSGCVKTRHGELTRFHASYRKFAIDFMRSIGVTDRKPQYALRKDCSQQTIKLHGALHEAQLLGHNPEVALRNYTDLSRIELKEGL